MISVVNSGETSRSLADGQPLASRLENFRRDRLPTSSMPTYSERLQALNELSDALLARTPALAGALPATGLAFAAAFLRASNLEHLIRREIPAVAALERFTRIEARKSLRVLPRGVAAHWVAGNVPLLGVFSWALSTLVGNLNVVRLSSRGEDVLTPLLDVLGRGSAAGQALAAETMVVRFATDDTASHQAMSAAADVRIAWGGQEAVESIIGLPARWDAETIVLGPRMSLAVIDAALVTDRALGRLATDIVYFDQQACSSPQWVFVKHRGSPGEFDALVDRFSRSVSAHSAAIGRHRLDPGETYRVELDRARVLVDGGRLRRDEGTAWTVAAVDGPDPRLLCANRFVQMMPIREVDEVLPHIPGNAQTVVIALDEADTERFSEAAARRGVHRFARPGEGNLFETPWDGLPLVTRLTRWTIRTDSAGAETTIR